MQNEHNENKKVNSFYISEPVKPNRGKSRIESTEQQQSNESVASFASVSDVLSSTTINLTKSTEKSPNVNRRRKSDDSSSFLNIVSDVDTSNGNFIQEPPKKKQKTAAKQAPRKRKLRPEDQRTLKILAEKFKADKDGMKCQVDKCKSKSIQCTKTANLKRHILQVHPEVFAQLFPHEINSKKRAELEKFNIIQDAVELVTVNGYPFSMLSASGMRGFIKSRVKYIQNEGLNAVVNRTDVVGYVSEENDLIKKFMSLELKGKIVSLMFDICTVVTLSMIGVNVNFMRGGEAACWSLGTIPIVERHTAVQLAAKLYEILAEYGIPLENVFSITTDTARNATATSDVLNLIASSTEESENIVEDSIFDEGDELDFGIDIENEAELQKIIDNMAAHTRLVEDMTKNVASKYTSIEIINQVNCGTHVFQLSVNGALNDSNSRRLIESVHDMCKLLRTQVFFQNFQIISKMHIQFINI